MKIIVQTNLLEHLKDGNALQAVLEKAACVVGCFHGLAGLALLTIVVIVRSRIGIVTAAAIHSAAECGVDGDPDLAQEK